MSLDIARVRQRVARAAENGLFVGTSSWKYPGWCGSIYDEQRYLTRSKFSEAKFNKTCLDEYAETFRTVCVDAGYYNFPSADYVRGLCSQVPPGFQFGFKVTDEVTIKQFPNLPRFGARKGMANPNFLNAEMFSRLFLGPLEPHRANVGPLIFEFSTFHKRDFEHGREFVDGLDRFLGALPRGWDYGVEIRNKTWLVPEYFQMLRTHRVAHVFNNWTRMPSILEQLSIADTDTADFMVARFLLKPGRGYEESVSTFYPYAEIKEINEEARKAAEEFLERAFRMTKRGYIYINNRLEGFAPETIAAILERLAAEGRKYVLIL